MNTQLGFHVHSTFAELTVFGRIGQKLACCGINRLSAKLKRIVCWRVVGWCLEMAGLMDKAKDLVADKMAHMEKPTADLTDVDVRDVTRDSVGLKSDVLIHNPYDHDLPILEITYRLRCGDREITSGTVADVDAVAANSDNKIEVGSKVAYSFLMNLLRDIGADWDIDYDFDVGVKLKLPIIHTFTIPLHRKGTIKLPTLSDLF